MGEYQFSCVLLLGSYFVVCIVFFCSFSLGNELCKSHTTVGYTAQRFDGNEYKNVTTSGCLENSNKAYKISLSKGYTINAISLDDTILVGQLRYSYDDQLWFVYDGMISPSGNNANLTTPLFARYLQLTLGHTNVVQSKCASFSIYACNTEAAPAVSLTPNTDIAFYDSVSIRCVVTGQPNPQVSWTTSNGYVFTSEFILNQFATTSGAQNSTLKLSKKALSQHGFRCLQNAVPCTTVICNARYPGSDVSKSAKVKIDIGPSPQSNFSTKLVMHHSAIVAWQKPLEDTITNYTGLRLVVTSIVGPPVIIYVSSKNRVMETTIYQIPSLQPCIFYVVELMANNYLGESTGVKTNFTTPGGVIGVSLNAKVANSSAVTTNWNTRVLIGRCKFLQVTQFILVFRCLSGLSELGLCAVPKNIYTNNTDRNATIGNLNPSTLYTMQITALTEQSGVNVTSNTVRFTTDDSTPSDGPANVSAAALNMTAIELRWGMVPAQKSHGVINSYIITFGQESNSMSNRTYMLDNTTHFAVYSGLAVCTEYRFSLQGCNRVGCGPMSVIKRRTADNINTSFTNNVTFIEKNDPNNVTVKVNLDNVGSSQCVTGFEIEYRKQNEATWTRIKSSSFRSSIYASGLKPHTKYEFRSRLNGHSSSGDWSIITQLTTAEGIPGPIRELQIFSRNSTSAVITWSSPSTPRGVIQTYLITVQGKRGYNESFNYQKEIRITRSHASGFINTNATIPIVFPATTYNICIKAWNNRYTSECTNISITNDAKPPLKPEKLTVQEGTIIHSKLRLMFHPVPDLNGPITKYQAIVLIRLRSTDILPSNFTSKLSDFKTAMANGLSFYVATELGRINRTFDVGDGLTSAGFFNAPLDTGLNYTIFIRAVTVWNGKTYYSSVSFVDINRYPVNEKPVLATGGQSARSITIKLPVFNAGVKYIRVMVQKVKNANDNLLRLSQYEEANLTTYAVAKRAGFVTPYVTAELSKASVESLDRFVIGDGKTTSRLKRYNKRSVSQSQTVTEYLNGPLEPESRYAVSFRAYHSQVVYFSSDWSAPIMTSSLPIIAPAPKGSSAGLIAGIVICVLVVPIFIMLGVVLWKRHKNEPKLNYRFSTMELVSNGGSLKAHENGSFADDVFESSNKFVLDHPTDFSHPPVPITEFPDYLAKMKERDYCFEDEFEELDDDTAREKQAAKKDENKDRNREKSAVPYDCFRVILHNRKNNQSDYINASLIDSYSKKNAYIASQTPLHDYMNDFWDMIWQKDVRTILVLSHPLDTDKESTPCYWPSSFNSTHYGNVVVKCEDATVDEMVDVRGFSIRVANFAERIVRLFQFKKWPERGIPDSVDEIFRFRDQVNQWNMGKQGRIVVQCSNGSGRSGTYIALDAILNNVRQSKMVDIFNFVKYLRSRRTNMVETDRQYEFLHNAILEVLTKVEQNIEITKKNADSVIVGLNKTDLLTGYTGFTRLFKQLNRGIPSVFSKILEGSKAINDYKNRYSFKVPQDSYRVRLPIMGTTKADASDYINATLVTMNDESRFITTQAPFGITVNDFWTMVYFSRAEVIVMLNDIEENSVEFSQYWPGSDSLSATYGNFKVTLELESTPFPCVIRRDFTFSELKNPDVHREVTQFHVLAWEDHDVPSSPFAVLQLSKYLANEHMMADKPPIIVQCSDGFGRSGTFCACLHTVKQLMTEGKVHIPDMLRKFRKRHMSFVENEVQFKFIFLLARDYVESRTNTRN